MARQLVELCVDEIISRLQTELPAELAVIHGDRGAPIVTMEAPRDYFTYPRAMGYRTPVCFVIGDSIDFLKEIRGANHVNARITINVTVLVEDKDADKVTRKAYRYQAAMHQVLDQVSLTPAGKNTKITLVVQTAAFSPLYSNTDDATAPNAVFRKEISLGIDAFVYEPQG